MSQESKMSQKLERLTRVPIREFWTNEASDFTPWLANEENIVLVSEAIRMDLEVEDQEKSVGRYWADILCKDAQTGHWVLIENQLEQTDHTHLGQLLTYAAGLNGGTVVWIAEGFTDEHRAALDWLNEITAETVNFFGLELELWRIGDSPMAAKLNVISQPNDWTKTIADSVRNLSEREQLNLEYWTALHNLLKQRESVVKPVKPTLYPNQFFYVGRTGFRIAASISIRDKWICIKLEISGTDAKPHFYLLLEDKAELHSEIGAELKWPDQPANKYSYISLYREADPEDREDWDEQHEWLCKQLETFHTVFSPRVKELDASDYIAEES